MNNFLIIANWKANIVDQNLFKEVSTDIEVAIAAPYPQITEVNGFTKASQDVSQFGTGAYTGEVPAEILKKYGVKYCLIGHSERRKYLGETTEMVGKKMEKLLEQEIIPVVCAQKLDEIPDLAKNIQADKYLVMFEPFTAISQNGQYNPIEPIKVEETIKEWASKLPQGVRFLYGGSVNKQNADQYKNIVSGFVIGHASLDPNELFQIVKKCSQQTTP